MCDWVSMMQKLKRIGILNDMNTVCVHYVKCKECKNKVSFKLDKVGHTTIPFPSLVDKNEFEFHTQETKPVTFEYEFDTGETQFVISENQFARCKIELIIMNLKL